MGCIASRVDINDIHKDTFQVVNIDADGNKTFKATIKVTETNLELHRKGNDPLIWPLTSLRQYGCKTEIFTFESGRKGPTGQGVYAFRCPQALQLFNMIQAFMRQQAHENPTVPAVAPRTIRSSSIDHDPLPFMELHPYEGQLSPQAAPDEVGPSYINVSYPTAGNHPNPMNIDCTVPNVPPPVTPFVAPESEVGHDYVNVSLQSPDQSSPDKIGNEGENSWVSGPKTNLVVNSKSFEKNVFLPNGHATKDSFDDETFIPPSLNYVQLDLNQENKDPSETKESKDSVTVLKRSNECSEESSPCSPQYVKIDFNKTNALNDVKLNSQSESEPPIASGSRKVC